MKSRDHINFILYYLFLDKEKKPKKTILSSKPEANGNAMTEEINSLSNNECSNSNYLFLVYELSKRYGDLVAVEEISFGVKQHECFGLLGVNGAGKSTTFKMMTGESMPNSGVQYLGGRDYYSDRKEVNLAFK